LDRRVTQGILNVLIFLAVLALIAIVGLPQYRELKPSSVRIGVDRTYGGLPFYLAELDTSRQYYKLEKIKPLFVDIESGSLEKLKRGECDIASVSWYDLLLSPVVDNDTIKVLGSVELHTAADAIIIPKECRTIRSLKDLTGKRLGFIAGDEHLVNLVLQKMEQRDKIKNITRIPLRASEIATALKDNKADALFVLDPYRSYLLYLGYGMLLEGLVDTYLMTGFPYQAVVMKKNFAIRNKKAALRMKNTFDAVLGFIKVHPEVARNAVVMKNEWPLDGTLLLNIKLPEYLRLAEIDTKRIEQLQTLMVLSGAGSCGMKVQDLIFGAEVFKN
jgi:ABC-type nitrate/sulfonate/bicarbonate transport system substrate-binding protein